MLSQGSIWPVACRVALPLALVSALVALAAAAAPAGARTAAFRPIEVNRHVVVFRVHGVKPDRILGAEAKLRREHARKSVERRVGVHRVRAAADHERLLKIRAPKRVRGGKLRVKLARRRGRDGPARPPDSTCSFDPATLTAPGCTSVFSDTGDRAGASAEWGRVDCASASRHSLIGGGDPHVTAAGAAQPSDQAHQLTVLDGDDVWGERCELGENWRPTAPMPAYEEGQRRLTMLSFRLPDSYPLANSDWQTVMQMKQAQPADNGGGTPVLALKASGGSWSLVQSTSPGSSDESRQLWSAPAATASWTRFVFDVTYSRDPGTGAVTVYADLNGDGDALDEGEQSATFSTYTLKLETSGGNDDGLAVGDSVPSLLRTGIYHSPAIPCPPPAGCASQVDNVQIVG